MSFSHNNSRNSVNLNMKSSNTHNLVVTNKLKIKDPATGIMIPDTTEKCIIFPFDRKKLKYMRDTYQKQMITDRCTADDITKVISNLEEACNNFKRHRIYKGIINCNVMLGLTVLLAAIAVIIAGLVKQNKGDSDTYKKSGHNMLTMNGILIFGFDVLVMYFGIVIVGCLSNDLNAVYLAKYDEVLNEHKADFDKLGMRWKIGTKRLWLELWLDEYTGPGRESKEDKGLNRSSRDDNDNPKLKPRLSRINNDVMNMTTSTISTRPKRISMRNSMMLGAGTKLIISPKNGDNAADPSKSRLSVTGSDKRGSTSQPNQQKFEFQL